MYSGMLELVTGLIPSLCVQSLSRAVGGCSQPAYPYNSIHISYILQKGTDFCNLKSSTLVADHS